MTPSWTVVVPVVAVLAVSCGGASQAPPASTSTASPTVGVSATVQVQDDVFTPQVLTVPAGAVVEWRWAGKDLHNVTGDDFASPSQGSGAFDHTFAQPGTYYYRCTLHTHMLGEVVVR